jgi:hypothetical protein
MSNIRIYCRHDVADYALWKKGYDGFANYRKTHGVIHESVYQSIDNPNDIPGEVQRKVYERDHGKCTQCGATENLHFDHILPFSKGGSSKVASNIQLLCAKYNLQKGARFV